MLYLIDHSLDYANILNYYGNIKWNDQFFR